MPTKASPTKHEHLEWAVTSRARNQVACLRLLRLFDDDPDYWKTKKPSRVAQELVGIGFSLWRAAFLAEKTGKRADVFSHGRDFLARVIEDNAIGYAQDKNSREWTFNYYTRNARNSLEFLRTIWGEGVPEYKGLTRNAVQRWDYCQDLLEQSIGYFEGVVSERTIKAAEKTAVRQGRVAAKQRRRDVRELTAADR